MDPVFIPLIHVCPVYEPAIWSVFMFMFIEEKKIWKLCVLACLAPFSISNSSFFFSFAGGNGCLLRVSIQRVYWASTNTIRWMYTFLNRNQNVRWHTILTQWQYQIQSNILNWYTYLFDSLAYFSFYYFGIICIASSAHPRSNAPNSFTVQRVQESTT